LRTIAPVVSAVAISRQFAAASFQVGGGDIVEQQGAVLEVAAGQGGFDEVLLAAQPIQRGVNLPGGDRAQPQHLAQRMTGGGGIQHPRGSQLGRRVEQAGDDQRECQITSALRRATGQQGIEFDAACGGEGGEDVAMGKRSDDLNSIGGGKQLLAAQHGAQLLDAFGRPVGEILEGSLLGLAVLAVAFAQQDGWR